MNFKPLMIALPVAFLIGCASEPTPDMLPGGQPTFDSYAIQAKAYVAERRRLFATNHIMWLKSKATRLLKSSLKIRTAKPV